MLLLLWPPSRTRTDSSLSTTGRAIPRRFPRGICRSVREEKNYPNDKAVLAGASVVWFPVKEVCKHPRNNCTSGSWISSFPECAAATLDPSPGALCIQISGSQVGLFPITCLTKQFHNKIILTLTFNTCQVTAWN